MTLEQHLERATTQSQGVISPDITAILEAFPAYLEVVKAAKEYLHGHAEVCTPNAPCDCGYEALRSALAKLEEGRS